MSKSRFACGSSNQSTPALNTLWAASANNFLPCQLLPLFTYQPKKSCSAHPRYLQQQIISLKQLYVTYLEKRLPDSPWPMMAKKKMGHAVWQHLFADYPGTKPWIDHHSDYCCWDYRGQPGLAGPWINLTQPNQLLSKLTGCSHCEPPQQLTCQEIFVPWFRLQA